MGFSKTRKNHGRVYATLLPNGLTVPWKPLSIGDYIKYTRDSRRGVFSLTFIENEIFHKSVLDESIKRQMDFLNAGLVSTVANNIWEHSGPTGVDAFNRDLDNARNEAFGEEQAVLNELLQLITMAFPYTPEEVYEMPYETMLLRAVQAEKKLLMLGIIQEPVVISPPAEEIKPQRQDKPKIDAKKIFDEEQARLQKKKMVDSLPPDPVISQLPKKKWWKKSPVLEAPSPQHLDFQTEGAELTAFGSSGWEKQDAHIARAKLVEDAQVIYKDLLAELAARKQNKGA